MALLSYWPPMAHLALVAACAATAWWRFESAPAVPSAVAMPADSVAFSTTTVTGDAGTDARDWQSDVQTVATRALFHPSRLAAADVAVPTVATPTEAEPEASPDVPASLAALRMVGYIDRGGRRLAILKTVDDGQSHIVGEGDEVAGAQVLQIGRSVVVIETAGQRINLELYPD